MEMISQREFARRSGCDEKVVRRKIVSGYLPQPVDGKLDAALVGTGWRKGKAQKNADKASGHALKTAVSAKRKPIASSRKSGSPQTDVSASPVSSPAVARPDESIEEAAERIVFQDGRVFASEAEAKRHKESFLALMRELDYDRENGAVVPVDDVVAAVAAEYALVRNRMLNIATRVAPRAAMLRSAEEVKALIDAEVALALQELSLDARGSRGEADSDAAHDAVRGRFRKPH